MQDIESSSAVKRIARNIKTRLEDQSLDGALLFLTGAGASHSCEIPVGGQFAAELEQELRDKGSWRDRTNDDLDVHPYEWAICQVERAERIKRIRDMINRARIGKNGPWKLNHCYQVLCEIWKEYPLYPRTLLTTNFDPLFHYALMEADIEAKLLRSAVEFEHMHPFDTRVFPSIIFLHGYWQNHFLLNTVKEFAQFKRKWAPRLGSELARFGFVVLGYSGHPKDIFFKTLRYITKHRLAPIAGEVYWCHVDAISRDTRKQLKKYPDVYAVKIKDADSFMLSLGVELGLPRATTTAAFDAIMDHLSPGLIQEYQYNASVDVSYSNRLTQRTGDELPEPVAITIKTHAKHPLPGENYAGIEIYAVKRRFDVSRFSQITLDYEAQLIQGTPGERPSFEFKLHSGRANHIKNIPIENIPSNGHSIDIDLKDFEEKEVVLSDIERIVIGANSEQIGCASELTIKLKRIRWS